MRSVSRRLVVFACAMVLLFRLPLVASGNGNRARPMKIAYSKWVDTVTVPGVRLLQGFTGGDVVGDFSGQVFVREVSVDGKVIRLEAEYSVDGERSFTALIRGGTDAATGKAILDGTILVGWRTGAPVHVEFETIPAPSPLDPACPGHPLASRVFEEGSLESELNDGKRRNAAEMSRVDREHRICERERRRADQEISERNHSPAALLFGV